VIPGLRHAHVCSSSSSSSLLVVHSPSLLSSPTSFLTSHPHLKFRLAIFYFVKTPKTAYSISILLLLFSFLFHPELPISATSYIFNLDSHAEFSSQPTIVNIPFIPPYPQFKYFRAKRQFPYLLYTPTTQPPHDSSILSDSRNYSLIPQLCDCPSDSITVSNFENRIDVCRLSCMTTV
jgi:hypothetical protein